MTCTPSVGTPCGVQNHHAVEGDWLFLHTECLWPCHDLQKLPVLLFPSTAIVLPIEEGAAGSFRGSLGVLGCLVCVVTPEQNCFTATYTGRGMEQDWLWAELGATFPGHAVGQTGSEGRQGMRV